MNNYIIQITNNVLKTKAQDRTTKGDERGTENRIHDCLLLSK
jgi:hypothetical protein